MKFQGGDRRQLCPFFLRSFKWEHFRERERERVPPCTWGEKQKVRKSLVLNLLLRSFHLLHSKFPDCQSVILWDAVFWASMITHLYKGDIQKRSERISKRWLDFRFKYHLQMKQRKKDVGWEWRETCTGEVSRWSTVHKKDFRFQILFCRFQLAPSPMKGVSGDTVILLFLVQREDIFMNGNSLDRCKFPL